MIRRFLFLSCDAGVAPQHIEPAARDIAERLRAGNPDHRPVRTTLCLPASGISGSLRPRHDAVLIEDYHAPPPLAAAPASDGLIVNSIDCEERIVRGEPWLARYRQRPGGAYRHMALALRAEGLTAREFSDAWSGHSGRVGTQSQGGAASLAIPAEVRGRAYVQNHPCDSHGSDHGDSVYDAINEVYFDDVAGLQQRVTWFRANVRAQDQAELFRASWYLALRDVDVWSA